MIAHLTFMTTITKGKQTNFNIRCIINNPLNSEEFIVSIMNEASQALTRR